MFNGGPDRVEGYHGGFCYVLEPGKVVEVFDREFMEIKSGEKGRHRRVVYGDDIARHIAAQLAVRGVLMLDPSLKGEQIPVHLRLQALQAVSEHLETVPENFDQMNLEREVAKSLTIKHSKYVKERMATKKDVDNQIEHLAENAEKEARKLEAQAKAEAKEQAEAKAKEREEMKAALREEMKTEIMAEVRADLEKEAQEKKAPAGGKK